MSEKTVLPRLNFIMLVSSRWDGEYSSAAFSMAQAVSKSHRVFFIDNPFTWKDYYYGRRSKPIARRREPLLHGRNNYHVIAEDRLIAVTPRLILPVNWLPKGRIYDVFSKINDAIISRCVRKLLKDYSIRDYVYVNSFIPLYFRTFPSYFKPKLFVYQTVDDIRHSEYLRKHGAYLEDEMIKKADVTLVTSTELRKLKEGVARSVHIIANAADISLFKTAQDSHLAAPQELAGEPRKVIIYVGNTIAARTDFDILKTIAARHPDKLLLMVGPYEELAVASVGLLEADNVRFIGPRKIEEVPAYLKYSHCAIIPFRCNTLTKSIYPLKINEYLATGTPVVTTSFSDDILSFKNVYVAHDKNEFSALVGKSIDEDSQERSNQRIREVARNTWDERAQRFLEIISEAYTLKHGR